MTSAARPGGVPLFSIVHGTFRLGDRLVFPNTNWTFGAHEHWAILGGNGSGKSLLADGVRGRLPLVQGELIYHFRPPPGLTPEETIGHVSFEDRKAEVHGAVVQSRWNSLEDDDALQVSQFLDYERVLDVNPYEVTTRQTQSRRAFAARRRRALALLQLQPLLNRAVLSLSNGERQRVEWAKALCRPVRLLVLDEPFTGLDKAMRRRLRASLARLMSTRLRVLLLTTRPEELPAQITHVIRVDHCRVTAIGPREQVAPRSNQRVHRRAPGHPVSSIRTGPPSFAPAARELLNLHQINVRYGRVFILRDLSWSVRAGESWALLGPNGSGKSTLLSLILGDNPQVYANQVTVFGRRLGDGESVWRLKQRIGWVSPELQVHFADTMTCFEAVGSGFHDSIGLFEPLTRTQRAAVRQFLRLFGLERFARTPLFGLSPGQQRLVLLARALVKSPDLLILDEPCQSLDEEHRQKFVSLVDRQIRRGAVTVIYVTHREDEIPPSIIRVLELRQGRARQRQRTRLP